MKEEYTAPKADIISFKLEEDLLGEPSGDASLVPGPPED
jgi:hypothetical protein